MAFFSKVDENHSSVAQAKKKKLMTPWLTGFAVLNSSNNENTLLHFDLLVVNKMADFFQLHHKPAPYTVV